VIEVFDPSRLADFSLFQGLSENQLERIRRALHSATFPARTHFVRWGQPNEALYIVQSGIVKISIPGAAGSEVILGFQGGGEVIGEISLVDGGGHSVDVFTHERSTLYRIDSSTFANCLETMPNLYRNVARILARHARMGARQMYNVARLSIDGRVAFWLLHLARDYGYTDSAGNTRIPLKLTQADIANCVGASRVRVNQTLANFTGGDYIDVEQNIYTILNRAALLALCEESLGEV